GKIGCRSLGEAVAGFFECYSGHDNSPFAYRLQILSYSAWVTICFTYMRFWTNWIKAIIRRWLPPTSSTHHLSLCLKLSSDGNTRLISSGVPNSPLRSTR